MDFLVSVDIVKSMKLWIIYRPFTTVNALMASLRKLNTKPSAFHFRGKSWSIIKEN